jgi:pimeloyl-ACP methyl ester carboxylesterase
MSFKKFFFRKRILIPLIFLVLILGFYTYARIQLGTNIPKTKPNVNHQRLGDLSLANEILTNRWGDTMQVEGGRLTVAEQRSKTDGNLVEIAFQRIQTQHSNPLPPIVFLAGGPGSPGTGVGQSIYFYLFQKLSEYADIILIDQRGTGSSIPNLRCRNSAALPTDITENVKTEILKSLKEKCKECAEEFLNMGIHLPSYNSKESADDIEDIRKALGYDEITLYGYSYGTSLAQEYIRSYEKYVSKAILAAPLTPDLSVKSPKLASKQFEYMDSLMKMDPRMTNYIPDFTEMVTEVHKRLKNQSEFIQIPLMDAVDEGDGRIGYAIFKGISMIKPHWELTLTDEHFQMMIASRIGQDLWITNLPALYYKISQGDYQDVGNWLRNFRRQEMPSALYFTVNGAINCTEETWDSYITESDDAILSHFGLSFGRYKELFDAFEVVPLYGQNHPVSGETPMLLIGGLADGRTPPSNMDTLSQRFPDSRFIKVANTGHNNLMDEEIMEGIITFLHDSLTQDILLNREVIFGSPVPYKYSMTDSLFRIIDEEGVDSAIQFYKQQKKLYVDVEDYIFNFGEQELNSLAYLLLNEKKIPEAIKILEFNIGQFPEAYNLYNSLGEMQIAKGDTMDALGNFHKALELNYFDANSQSMVNKLKRQRWVLE